MHSYKYLQLNRDVVSHRTAVNSIFILPRSLHGTCNKIPRQRKQNPPRNCIRVTRTINNTHKKEEDSNMETRKL